VIAHRYYGNFFLIIYGGLSKKCTIFILLLPFLCVSDTLNHVVPNVKCLQCAVKRSKHYTVYCRQPTDHYYAAFISATDHIRHLILTSKG